MSISPTIKIQNMKTRTEEHPRFTIRDKYEINGLGAVSIVYKKINPLGDQHMKTRYAEALKMCRATQAARLQKMEDQGIKITAIAKEIVRSDDMEELGPLEDALMVQSL